MTIPDDYIPTFITLPGIEYARMYCTDHSVYVSVSSSTEPYMRRRVVKVEASWTYEFFEEHHDHPSIRLLGTPMAHGICNQGYHWCLTDIRIEHSVVSRTRHVMADIVPLPVTPASPASTRKAITGKKTRGLEL